MTLSLAGKQHSAWRISPLQKWFICLGLVVCAVGVSYVWLDRPIALFSHQHLHRYNLFEKLTYIPEIIGPFVVVAFAPIGLWALSGRALSKFQTVAVLAAANLAVTAAIKNQLKFAFGRTWPETWVRNNLSFIRDGVYGFNPFHGGPGFAAFPSGHTAAICAVMSVLWICYPRFRVLYAICIGAVAVGLVGADFHFLSDVIAGGFLGISTGWLTVVLWELGQRQLSDGAAPDPDSGGKSHRTPARDSISSPPGGERRWGCELSELSAIVRKLLDRAAGNFDSKRKKLRGCRSFFQAPDDSDVGSIRSRRSRRRTSGSSRPSEHLRSV